MPTPSLFLLRSAITFCFLGFGVWEIIDPSTWTTYVPTYMGFMDSITLVLIHGVVLTATGIGVLSGYFPKLFTTLSVLLLLNISMEIFLQEGFTDIFIRDVALALAACALCARSFSPREAPRGQATHCKEKIFFSLTELGRAAIRLYEQLLAPDDTHDTRAT